MKRFRPSILLYAVWCAWVLFSFWQSNNNGSATASTSRPAALRPVPGSHHK